MGDASDNSDAEVQELLTASEGIDYVRFMIGSLSGEPYTKAVPARHLQAFYKHGVPFWEGMTILGAGCDIFKSIFNMIGTNNIPARAMPGTFYAMPWATSGKHKVGGVLVEPVYPDGRPLEASPRYVARQQLQRLESHGLWLKSGTEMEFMLLDGDDKSTPISSSKFGYATAAGHANNEEFMYDVDKLMLQAGVSLENIHEEVAPGQFEFTLAPALGIDAADQVFKFKHSLREIAAGKGMAATFMSMPEANGSGNGMHYNHSLLDSAGANAFYDAGKPDNLSDIARYWIGGLMKHAKALCALCFTTVNCARRMGGSWAPSTRTWGLDDRAVFLRVKSQRPEFTYMENRLPGGAANPYLVMAATVAAGLDGIEKQIPCPPAISAAQQADMLPRSLAEAIDDLKADKELCQALGDTFIKWFIEEKEQSELAGFPGWEANDMYIDKERQRFLLNI